jgi:hypothetical protein
VVLMGLHNIIRLLYYICTARFEGLGESAHTLVFILKNTKFIFYIFRILTSNLVSKVLN